ncbi:MAG: DASH family cryptochrome [Bacteroidota bacterium]|jgi:deoxyribodipyrimidine photo-lyase
MKTKIFWFRNDLRVHDNEALLKAASSSDELIPLYIFDPRNFEKNEWGFSRSGFFRTKFLIESVQDLRNNIQQKGGKLIVRYGYPEKIIPALCKENGVATVYFSKEVAPEEVKLENLVSKELSPIDVNWKEVWTSTLYSKNELPFSIPRMPDLFTMFRKKTERESKIGDMVHEPERITTPKGINEGEIPDIESLCGESFEDDPREIFKYKGGESKALAHLQNYVWETEAIKHYQETRNELKGTDFSSRFSPWLALGCISPRKIYHEVMAYEKNVEKNKSTYWLVFELVWRDFFRFSMEKHGQKYFRSQGLRESLSYEFSHDKRKFIQWIEGRTGHEFIDAIMNELRYTGFISNRARQVAASYLVHDMNIDWLMGASYFESRLIDYDVCNNYGNWAYIAGVGNDARPDRYFDVDKQARLYDKDKSYRKLWTTEDEEYAAVS